MRIGRQIQLAAFDMEGCLTGEPTVWKLMHRMNGTWESHGAPYWDAYRSGAMGYDEFARMDVAAWRGAPMAMLEAAASQVPLTEGCATMLADLRAAGVAVAIITNGLACAAERFRRDFGVAHIFANRVGAQDGVLDGHLDILVPYAAKGELLGRLADQMGLSRDRVAAIGDSEADVAMFAESVISIAVGASPVVQEAATHAVGGGSLSAVRDIILNGCDEGS